MLWTCFRCSRLTQLQWAKQSISLKLLRGHASNKTLNRRLYNTKPYQKSRVHGSLNSKSAANPTDVQWLFTLDLGKVCDLKKAAYGDILRSFRAIVENACRKRKSAYDDPGVDVSESTHNALSRSELNDEDFQNSCCRIWEVYGAVRQHSLANSALPLILNRAFYGRLQSLLVHWRDFTVNNFMVILEDMQSFKLEAGVGECTRGILLLGRLGDVRGAEKFASMYEARSGGLLRQDAVVNRTLLQIYAAAGETENAVATFMKLLNNYHDRWRVMVRAYSKARKQQDPYFIKGFTPSAIGELNNLFPNDFAFHYLIDSFLKSGDLLRADALFDLLQDKDAISDLSALQERLGAALNQKSAELADSGIEELPLPLWNEPFKEERSSEHLNEIFESSGEKIHPPDKFILPQVTPNIRTYNAMIASHCSAGNLTRAVEIYNAMIKNDVKPTPITFSHLLSAKVSDSTRNKSAGGESNTIIASELWAKQAFEALTFFGYTPDRYHYGMLMEAYAKSGDWTTVSGIVEKIRSEGGSLDGIQYNILMRALINHYVSKQTTDVDAGADLGTSELVTEQAKASRANQMLAHLHLLIEARISETRSFDVQALTVLVGAYLDVGHSDGAIGWFHFGTAGRYLPNSKTNLENNATLTNAEVARQISDMFFQTKPRASHQFWEDVFASCQTIKPDVALFTALIDGFAKLGNMDRAVEFFKLMPEEKVEPNIKTYTSIVRGYSAAGDPQSAERWFRASYVDDEFVHLELRKRVGPRCKPDVVAYNTIIAGYALQIKSKMRTITESFHDDTSSGHGYLSSFWREVYKDYMRRADVLIHEMNEQGIRPDPATFGILIDGHVARAQLFQHHKIGEDDQHYIVNLDDEAIESALRDALSVYRRMVQAGVQPTSHIWASLLIPLAHHRRRRAPPEGTGRTRYREWRFPFHKDVVELYTAFRKDVARSSLLRSHSGAVNTKNNPLPVLQVQDAMISHCLAQRDHYGARLIFSHTFDDRSGLGPNLVSSVAPAPRIPDQHMTIRLTQALNRHMGWSSMVSWYYLRTMNRMRSILQSSHVLDRVRFQSRNDDVRLPRLSLKWSNGREHGGHSSGDESLAISRATWDFERTFIEAIVASYAFGANRGRVVAVRPQIIRRPGAFHGRRWLKGRYNPKKTEFGTTVRGFSGQNLLVFDAQKKAFVIRGNLSTEEGAKTYFRTVTSSQSPPSNTDDESEPKPEPQLNSSLPQFILFFLRHCELNRLYNTRSMVFTACEGGTLGPSVAKVVAEWKVGIEASVWESSDGLPAQPFVGLDRLREMMRTRMKDHPASEMH
ncbi:hypothetical protein BJ742DRAFT_786132 [Cladochytrium replicatum]|nr:hypothetical protein BJ742DRAFT_786132 [Cladochytrium replicatum]